MFRFALVLGLLALGALLVMNLSVMTANAQYSNTSDADINPDHSLEEQQNVEAAKNLIQTFASGDRDYLLGAISRDVIWEVKGAPMQLPTHGIWKGSNGLIALLDTSDGLWRTESFQADGIWADGRVVVVRGRETDAAISTGKHFEQNWVLILTFYEGKVTHGEIYGDSGAQLWSLQP